MSVSSQNNIQILLEQTVEQIANINNGFSKELDALKNLQTRLLEGRFHLAVLGQFKRGKSTLLNALLGDNVLPTAVVPLTAIPTFIEAGELSAKILFDDKKPPAEYNPNESLKLVEFLSKYVAEANNPANQLNVQQVEVFHPAKILRNGVVLIDTPGIGSTFKHNTEATLNFLPQCDAAMFLVSADPPITEAEIEFLKRVRSKVPRLFFILNKVDYLTDDEKKEVLAFIKRVLSEQVGLEKDTEVFSVSARTGLQARQTGSQELWEKSGLKNVEAYLVDFLANEKTEALKLAVRKKASDILADVLMRMHLSVKSLQMPLEDLEKRLEIFKEKLVELEQAKVSEIDILEGDQKRTHEFLEEHSEQLRQKSKTYLKGVVEETLSRLEPGQLKEDAIDRALAEVIPGFFEYEMGRSTEIFRNKMHQVLTPHREKLRKLIDSIRQTAAELFEIPYQKVKSEFDFEMAKKPYWVSEQWVRSFQRISRGLLDRFLTAAMRRTQLNKRAMEQISELVMQNVENLRWAVFQNIDKSFIRFRSEMKEQFEQTLIATRGAVEAALQKRKEHSEMVAGELSRLDAALMILTDIKDAFDADEALKSEN